MCEEILYKIVFINQSKVYEVFAEQVMESNMFGFIEVETLVFDEASSVVIDPNEERLKKEFANVDRTYIPINAIVRIDEVTRKGTAQIHALEGGTSKVTMFPGHQIVAAKNTEHNNEE